MSNSKETCITVLKSLFGTIPFIGSALDEVLFEHWGRLRQNRVNSFVEEFAKYVETLGLNSVNISDMKSEHFVDAFAAIILSVAKTNSERKIEYFKRILARLIVVPVGKIDFLPTLLDILEKVDDTEIIILEYFYKIINDTTARESHIANIKSGLHNSFRLSEEEYMHYKMSLASKCLLQDDVSVSASVYIEGSPVPISEYLRNVKISLLGSKFIEFLIEH
ncbi:MAG: hypothetical protein FWC67_01955 [Defluviitaleaceae bacterium]|nr:hypothetical protein [Defluviitaleaceae bacterium]